VSYLDDLHHEVSVYEEFRNRIEAIATRPTVFDPLKTELVKTLEELDEQL
jgi:hypothetical protein